MREGPSHAKAKGHDEEPALGSADLMKANLYGFEQSSRKAPSQYSRFELWMAQLVGNLEIS